MQVKASHLSGVEHGRGNGDSLVRSANLAMRGLERVVDQLSSIELPILIIGESGTGKRTIAHRIHRLAAKNGEPFHELTAADLNSEFRRQEDSLSSVPFSGRATLYVSNVAEATPTCQAWLLQLIGRETGLAGTSFSGRVIVSSAIGLDESVISGRMREDLYYGLSGVCLRVPPLRHRRDDIPMLAEHFIERYAHMFGRPKPTLSSNAWRFLLEHNWPGNVRELENTVKTLVAVGDERIAISALREIPGSQSENVGDGLSLKQAARAASRRAERELILRVLNKTRWNRKRAAQELKVSYKALLYKLKQIGLDDEVVGEESTL